MSNPKRVKVWNENEHDLEEMFKGDKIKIPAKSYIEMEFFEAYEFKGQGRSMEWIDPVARIQDPKSMKKIRLEPIQDAAATTPKAQFQCMSCKHELLSAEELEAHIKVHHPDAKKTDINDLNFQTTSRPVFTEGTKSENAGKSKAYGKAS